LTSLNLTPHAIKTRDPLEFALVLAVKRDCELTDLHLFFYNSFGERVAIIDLRDPEVHGGARLLRAGQTVRFSGRVARVVLVDGLYRVGFCVRTTRHFLVRHDLAELGVSANASANSILAYAPEYQGTTLLDYQFNVQFS
jgi:hypothetical protein